MSDKGIKEIRRVRHQISEECGHDVDQLVSYYQKMEEELRVSGEFRFADDRLNEFAISGLRKRVQRRLQDPSSRRSRCNIYR